MTVLTLILLFILASLTCSAQTAEQDSMFNSYMLKEIKVKIPAKTRMKDGNMLTRVVGTSVSTVGTAEDVLLRVPGIVRLQGQLQVIGKGTPVYYINGRRVYDLSELQRLSSHDVKDVEVITTPGSQYGAEVNAVVRIRTVRRSGEGLGISADFKDELAPSCPNNTLGTTVNLNYRRDEMDVFGGFTFDDCYLGHYDTDVTQQTFGSTNFAQTGTTHMDQQYNTIRYNFGINYQLSDTRFIGFKVERADNLKGDTGFKMDEDILRNGVKEDHLYAETHTDADGVNSWLDNLYYNGEHGRLGVDWNADFYTTSETGNARTIELSEAASQVNSASAIKHVVTNSDARNRLLATKLLLSYPIGAGKLQAGTELVFTKRKNLYDITEESIANDKSSVRENTYALFAEYGTMIPKAGMLSLGLRYEHVDFSYENAYNPTLNLNRNPDNLLPFLSFSTELGQVQASLGYTTKTRRPDYRILRTNIEYNNRFTLSTGDPTLKSEVRHDVNLNLHWNWLNLSTFYSLQQNGLYDWSYPYDDNGTALISWVNLDKPIHRFSTYLNASPTIGLWQINYTVGLQKQWLSLDLPDPRASTGYRRVDYNKPMFVFNTNNTFRIPVRKGSPVNLGLNSELLSSAHYGNAELTNWFWNLTFAVQKSFLKNDALSLRLSCGDIFHTAYHNVVIDLGNYQMQQSHILGQQRDIYDFQRISLSAHYRFNATKSKYKGTGAGQDSRSRM